MAMASGTDPLDRLQAGARDLRAEREQCHAAAVRACRTETGAAFSTGASKPAAPEPLPGQCLSDGDEASKMEEDL